MLLDRFGPRRVQAGLLACAGAGSLLFAIGQGMATLASARALIGLGFAGGLMSGFKAVVLWVPESRRALANAAIMSFGALGILVATTPTELAVEAVGWRAVFIALAAITFAVATLIFVAVPEQGAMAAGERLGGQIASLSRILCDPVFWRLAPLLATTAGTHIAIQTLWAGPWFRDVAGLERIGVANHLMAMAVAFFAGILLSGAVADWFVRRGVDLLDRDARLPRPVPVLRARDRAAVDRPQSTHVGGVRHDWAGGGARVPVAVVAFWRRPVGPRYHRDEPRPVPVRVWRAVRDRRDHRPVPDHSDRRLRPARLPGRLRRIPRRAGAGAALVSASAGAR